MSLVVIKLGGAVMEQAEPALNLFRAVAQMQEKGFKVVLVHGGGIFVEQQMQAQNVVSDKLNGLRVTPDEHMPIVVGALAGYANKLLVSYAKQSGVNAAGISLADGGLTTATEVSSELGAVGICKANSAALVMALTDANIVPVVSSIAMSETGRLLNVNADDAATVIAQLLQADLVLLSDVDGVLDGNRQLIPELDEKKIEQLVVDGVITDGMIPKTRAALATARSLQRPIAVANWRYPERLADLLAGAPVGTRILP
ncbi:acetylglutamate kinase [Echinimonas agarilytica]|uniref:Acetylglutamate kinase n=1 Tax=Echinimonas agarilytica TaxID=1215918 RepID=A0AA41W4H7_9GAMM|nr:acetylglutamate kinase [Echinimonas agarilytica]MCM2678328.1 acetylglutamate kinase [Echinimonas agarilytica]